jgi:hypothetical protein
MSIFIGKIEASFVPHEKSHPYGMLLIHLLHVFYTTPVTDWHVSFESLENLVPQNS